jgi:hypothetical protein
MLKERTWRCGLRAILSTLLIAAVLFSALLAVSPSLHQILHKDANQATHECVVTMLQKQQVCGDAPAPLLLGFTPTFSISIQNVSTPAVSQVDYAWSGSRAPPVVLL